ncbi:helix-turn-helix transcriptional regulator [Anaerococcus murdochii]|uniref:Helix-turn-helix transcriptional regulator n=1 Tax=Anaerococcus murdochii TaxID=411577 RepID=A0ABS7T0K2_9FIRM|nr:helix-turn-helix transcriptional regulator [Anaerococcus murdochii]MBZ2387315.1 helix-turn-helix transcriptional regulator [Anaerococcus murdochii]
MMTEHLREKGEAYDKKIRARLRIKVKESGVPIQSIAESIGKSPPSVYRYLSLKNKSRLPIEIIVKILAAIEVNEAEFFKEVDEMD